MSKLSQAKARADAWQGQWEQAQREADVSHHFDHVGPHRLIAMWETWKNLEGKKLSDFEFQALVERWLAVFHEWPPFDDDDCTEETEAPTAPEPELPADDTMLRARDVVRLTGVSLSTIKRMVLDGRFPVPLRPTPRRIVWTAGEVKAWLGGLEGARRKVRS